MDLTTFRIVVVTSMLSVLLPVAIYFVRMKNLPQQTHVIGQLIIISAVFDLINFTLFSMKQANYWSANLYNIALFVMLTRFFDAILFQTQYRKVFYAGILCFCIAVVIAMFVQDIRSEYQSIVWVTQALILCSYCYAYYLFVSGTSTHVIFNPHLQSELSIVGGVFVYFSFSIGLFIFMNYIMTNLDPDTSRMMWSVHNANNIIKNIFFAFGIYYTGKRKITITEQTYNRLQRERKRESYKN